MLPQWAQAAAYSTIYNDLIGNSDGAYFLDHPIYDPLPLYTSIEGSAIVWSGVILRCTDVQSWMLNDHSTEQVVLQRCRHFQLLESKAVSTHETPLAVCTLKNRCQLQSCKQQGTENTAQVHGWMQNFHKGKAVPGGLGTCPQWVQEQSIPNQKLKQNVK